MEIQFSSEEIAMLQKGLDAFEGAEMQSYMVGDLMGTMMMSMIGGKKDDPEYQKMVENKKREREEKFRELEAKRSVLSERVVLLKAKLIQMKDKKLVEEVICEPKN